LGLLKVVCRLAWVCFALLCFNLVLCCFGLGCVCLGLFVFGFWFALVWCVFALV